MSAGGLARMAIAPALAFGAYWVLRPLSPTLGMTAGAVVMLALALLPGTGRHTAGFTQG